MMTVSPFAWRAPFSSCKILIFIGFLLILS